MRKFNQQMKETTLDNIQEGSGLPSVASSPESSSSSLSSSSGILSLGAMPASDGVRFDVPVVNPQQSVIISREAQLIPEGERVPASCVWLPGNLEDTPRKSMHIIIVFHRMERRRENLLIEILDVFSKQDTKQQLDANGLQSRLVIRAKALHLHSNLHVRR